MNNQKENIKVVPELRFGEFDGDGEWMVIQLGDKTSKVGSGKTPRGGSKNYKTKGRPFVRSQNIGWGILLLDDVVYIDEKTHRTFLGSEIRIDDVLLNITGASIGRSAIASSVLAGGNVNQHVCIIRAKKKKLNPVFLNQFIISHNCQNQIDSYQAGGNREGLNFSQIRSLKIPSPPFPLRTTKNSPHPQYLRRAHRRRTGKAGRPGRPQKRLTATAFSCERREGAEVAVWGV